MNYLETYNASEGFFAFQDDPNTSAMLLLTNHGVFYEFEDINSKKLVQEMKKLMIDHKKLNDFQKKSWKDFIYQQEEVSKMQDKIRKTIFKNFFIK